MDMQSPAGGSFRPIPDKLARLRRVRAALRAQHQEIDERIQRLAVDRARAQRELVAIETEPKPYPYDESARAFHERAVEQARQALETVQQLFDEAVSEREEVAADLNPVGTTVNALERHLGIDSRDDFMPNDFRVSR